MHLLANIAWRTTTIIGQIKLAHGHHRYRGGCEPARRPPVFLRRSRRPSGDSALVCRGIPDLRKLRARAWLREYLSGGFRIRCEREIDFVARKAQLSAIREQLHRPRVAVNPRGRLRQTADAIINP